MSLAIALSLSSLPLYSTSVQTQLNIKVNQNSENTPLNPPPIGGRDPAGGQAQNTPPDPPPRGDREPAGGLGGSNATCKNTSKPLTALVPLQAEQRLTTSENPTFWFYIPYAPEEIQSVEFSLHDREENDIYRTTLKLTKTPGIIGIRLPSSAKYALKQGEFYHWYLVIKCGQDSQSSLSVNEWVQKMELTPDRQIQIDAAKPDIWYDSLTRIAELRRAAPADDKLKDEWNNLLKSAQLQEIADEPLVETIQLSEDVAN